MNEWIEIDGSRGEGGGQVLRSSLTLSLVTQRPFRIRNIRAGRGRPGLLRQHLAAVRLATEIGRARVEGATPGSQSLDFAPTGLHAGDYSQAIGTAGSTTLVLQTVLPALLTLQSASSVQLAGGTHNPAAPPFDFLQRTYLPLLERMGIAVEATLVRPGFFPAGGGALDVALHPRQALQPLHLPERGRHLRTSGRAFVAHLPTEVGTRELAVLARKLALSQEDLELVRVEDSIGPGNVVTVTVESEHITEVFTSFGEKHLRAEHVATQVADQARRYLQRGTVVGHYLTDQLLLPLALAGGGSFCTGGLSPHAKTNIEVIETFLPVRFAQERREEHGWVVRVLPA